jgi:hypothetical protein
MSAPVQSLLLALAIALAFWWINQPVLSLYSLQAFSLSIFLYFVSKRISKSKLWHVLPGHESWEMVVATFAFCLVIGATGNTSSPFFVLTFIHLFFLVMTTHYSTSLVSAGLLVLFHYALSPEEVATNWPTLLSIPVILIFFLFGKRQRDEVLREQKLLAITQQDERSLSSFASIFLKHKLNQLKELLKYPQMNQDALLGQLLLIEIELDKVLAQVEPLPNDPTLSESEPTLTPAADDENVY